MGENDLVSRSRVRKAGQNVKNNKATQEDYKIISLWRSKHISIITAMVNAIKRKLNKNKSNGVIIARRLKRLSSIELKLKRFQDMQLDRMQDIAGVRIIFKELAQVEHFQKSMETTYLKGSRKFKLISTKDYINNPKNDGYRSIHQIFEYNDNVKMCLELQIRTKLQHYWATAVEVLDMKSRTKIKQGSGESWNREFFKLCSELFSLLENPNKENNKKDICQKIDKLDKEYNILQNLKALAVSNKNIENQANNKNYYFIVLLDFDKSTLRITGFKKRDFEEAKKLYDFYEEDLRDKNSDVVLISLDEVKMLKKAFPNYYLDSNSFIDVITKELQGQGFN